MKKTALSLLAAPLFFAAAPAQAVIDNDAAVVLLRKSCNPASGAINNCFTDIPSLVAWIWGTRTPAPSATSPLLVDIGPGDFNGPFNCDSGTGPQRGWVSLKGAGPTTTRIVNLGGVGANAMYANNCANLQVSDLGLLSNYSGVGWEGGGAVPHGQMLK